MDLNSDFFALFYSTNGYWVTKLDKEFHLIIPDDEAQIPEKLREPSRTFKAQASRMDRKPYSGIRGADITGKLFPHGPGTGISLRCILDKMKANEEFMSVVQDIKNEQESTGTTRTDSKE